MYLDDSVCVLSDLEKVMVYYYSNGHFGVNAYNSGRANTKFGVGYTFKSRRKLIFLSNKIKNIPNSRLLEINIVLCVTHTKKNSTLFTSDK